MWSDATVTKRGALVLEQWVKGTTLTITRAKLGSETVETSSLDNQTDVSGYTYDGTIAVSGLSNETPVITVQILPRAAQYTVKQIGIFARLGTGTETLIAIYQDEDGVSVPNTASMPEYVYYFRAIIDMDITGTADVTVESGMSMDRDLYDPDADGIVEKADYATSAGTADTATTASKANYATSAGNATTADKATALADDSAYMKSASYTGSGTTYVNNAKHATSADSATTATKATTADKATALADDSAYMKKADYVSGTSYVKNASHATSADSAATATKATALADDSAYMKAASYTGSGTAYVNNAAHATSADSATNATNASWASNASWATNAVDATNAGNATNANYASLPKFNDAPADLDSAYAPGAYWISGSNTHSPLSGKDNGLLIVITQNLTGGSGSMYNYQIVLTKNALYLRFCWDPASHSWTEWCIFSGTAMS